MVAGNRNLQEYKLTIKSGNPSKPVKNKDSIVTSSETEERRRWAGHFEEILNGPPPKSLPDILPTDGLLDIDTIPPTRAEVTKVIKTVS